MNLTAGLLGIDFSGARPSLTGTFKAGGRFIIRYSAGAGNAVAATQWKLCGVHEIRDAVAAGLDFIANSEWYESRVTEGAKAGAADGAADLTFWKSRGLARGSSIYVSWDAAPVRAKWDAVVAYLRAYEKALGGYYHVDCYAGTPFLTHAIGLKVIRYGWRPNAGSWSGDGLPYQPSSNTAAKRAALVAQALCITPAHIWQTGNYWWSKGADENLIVRSPVGSHREALAAAATPPPVAPKPAPKPAPAPVPAKPPAPVHTVALAAVRFSDPAPNNLHAVYLVLGSELLWVNAATYTALGRPPVSVLDKASNLWALPVVKGTPDYRGKA